MGKRLSDAAWFEVRRRYVDDKEPAKVIAREYGITPSSIYKRAARGNWPAAGGGPPTATADLAATVERLERIVTRLEAGLSVGSSNGS